MIDNREYKIHRSEFKQIEELPELLSGKVDGNILRWYVTRVSGDDIFVETTLLTGEDDSLVKRGGEAFNPGKQVVVSIIPTGVGCEIGGYAADAAPATALLASCTDYLVTNPNAVNASDFIYMPGNVLYAEGYMIDLFCKGQIDFYKPFANKVGLIIEQTGREELEMVFNIINTVRAVHGIDLEHYVVTDERIGGRCERGKSGAYIGKIANPGTLFRACESLLERGVNAIAVTSNITDLPPEEYARHFEGEHPNPVGGAEAIISHLICRNYRVPAAHAPMVNLKDFQLKHNVVDARGAGEYSSPSGLACVLIGLGKAPQLERTANIMVKDAVNINNLTAVVAPAGTLGGIPTLYAQRYGISIIAVKENKTILEVTRESLGLDNVIEVNNYVEAAGILQALKHGISLKSLRRPLETLRF
jgi:hypothetical protein